MSRRPLTRRPYSVEVVLFLLFFHFILFYFLLFLFSVSFNFFEK